MKPDDVLWLWQHINEPPADDELLPAFQRALLVLSRAIMGRLHVFDDDQVQEFCNHLINGNYPDSWPGLAPENLSRKVAANFSWRCRHAVEAAQANPKLSVCDSYQISRRENEDDSIRSMDDQYAVTLAEAEAQVRPNEEDLKPFEIAKRLKRCLNEIKVAEFAGCGNWRAGAAAVLVWWDEHGTDVASRAVVAGLMGLSADAAFRLVKKAQAVRQPGAGCSEAWERSVRGRLAESLRSTLKSREEIA